MEALEVVCLQINLQIEHADRDIAQATIQRPTTGQVQEAWGEVLRVWDVLTEEERADLLGSVVQTVEMTEKESVTLELLPVPHSLISYSNRFELKSHLGAGAEVIAINSPVLTTHTFPPVELDYEIVRPRRVRRGRIETERA